MINEQMDYDEVCKLSGVPGKLYSDIEQSEYRDLQHFVFSEMDQKTLKETIALMNQRIEDGCMIYNGESLLEYYCKGMRSAVEDMTIEGLAKSLAEIVTVGAIAAGTGGLLSSILSSAACGDCEGEEIEQ